MYDRLETNICKQLMQFNEFPFPKDVSDFTTREDVLKYLKDCYLQFIKDKPNCSVHLESRIVNVDKSDPDSKWSMQHKRKYRDIVEKIFDF